MIHQEIRSETKESSKEGIEKQRYKTQKAE